MLWYATKKNHFILFKTRVTLSLKWQLSKIISDVKMDFILPLLIIFILPYSLNKETKKVDMKKKRHHKLKYQVPKACKDVLI